MFLSLSGISKCFFSCIIAFVIATGTLYALSGKPSHSSVYHAGFFMSDARFRQFLGQYPDSPNFYHILNKHLQWQAKLGACVLCTYTCARVDVKPDGKVEFQHHPIPMDSLSLVAFKFLIAPPFHKEQIRSEVTDLYGNTVYATRRYFNIRFIPEQAPHLQLVAEQICKALTWYRYNVAREWYNTTWSDLYSWDQDFINRHYGLVTYEVERFDFAYPFVPSNN